jgi:hypothetical protein
MRDVALEETMYMTFTTRSFSTGVPTTLSGSPVVSAYENDSVTQISGGITLGVDHDSVTGLNLLTILVRSFYGFEYGKDYSLVITTGTVGGVSVVGEVVGEFSVGKSASSTLLLNSTSIASLSSQTSFTLTTASTNDDVYNGSMIVVTDATTRTQKAVGVISDYTGSTKTVTLDTDPAIFTMAIGDLVNIIAISPLVSQINSAATEARLAELDSGNLPTDVASVQTTVNDILTDTADIQPNYATSAELAKVPKSDSTVTWNATALASINAEVDTAFSDYDPPTRAELTSDKAEIITDLDDIKGTGFVKDTHSLVDIEAYVDILDDGTSGNAKIATDVAAVLVDTGTTLDAALAVVDSNVDAILVDTGTTIPGTITTLQADTDNIQTRLPTSLVNGRMSSDMVAISGSTAAADNLEASVVTGGLITGTAATGTLSTTQCTTSLTAYADDQLIGRVIVFTSGAAQGEATDITDSALASGLLTFTALTTAPGNGDTFVIV